MGKNKDLIQILLFVLLGMFIPFLGSLIFSFGLDISNINDFAKIGKTFGYFLLFFALELIVVYLYFKINYVIANKKIERQK
jgi:hypothetical protein